MNIQAEREEENKPEILCGPFRRANFLFTWNLMIPSSEFQRPLQLQLRTNGTLEEYLPATTFGAPASSTASAGHVTLSPKYSPMS